jgi:hypothetical protein
VSRYGLVEVLPRGPALCTNAKLTGCLPEIVLHRRPRRRSLFPARDRERFSVELQCVFEPVIVVPGISGKTIRLDGVAPRPLFRLFDRVLAAIPVCSPFRSQVARPIEVALRELRQCEPTQIVSFAFDLGDPLIDLRLDLFRGEAVLHGPLADVATQLYLRRSTVGLDLLLGLPRGVQEQLFDGSLTQETFRAHFEQLDRHRLLLVGARRDSDLSCRRLPYPPIRPLDLKPDAIAR